jgi:hypothetical protein
MEGELKVRCFYCGDSTRHRNKKHLSLNLKQGLYHCFRCGASGSIPPGALLTLCAREGIAMNLGKVEEKELDVHEGPASSRPSMLKRYHAIAPGGKKGIWDAFELRDPQTSLQTGWMMRSGKASLMTSFLGTGLMWPEGGLTSDAVVVEGPYDVLHPDEVAVGGFISWSKVKMLIGRNIYLYPDGDTWQDPYLFSMLKETIRSALRSRMLYLEGVFRIPSKKVDPDQVKAREALYMMDRKDLYKMLKEASHR